MTILIGMNGYKHSGKDTASDAIEEWGRRRDLMVVRRGFADLLKLSAARSLGIYSAQSINDAIVLMDSLKESGMIDICIPSQSIMKLISGREFLKWYGTEGHRDVFGDDFWIDLILPNDSGERLWTHYWEGPDGRECDIAIVTDVRFVNEAKRIKDLGGVVWRIDRWDFTDDNHMSEQPLPSFLVDETISNKGTIDQFKTTVNSLMTAEYHMRFVPGPKYEDAEPIDG